jgi:threonyl-tRNA synthetase
MINITLPDGNQKTFDNPITALDVAKSIGAGLAKAALAASVDGRLVDLSFVVEKDANVAIITDKSNEALGVIRHSCAHVLAQAVKQLFPGVQITIGPTIENGFYYDFAFKRPFTPEDLIQIEKRMKEIVAQNIPVEHSVLPKKQAIEFFEHAKEHYKVEIIRDILEDHVSLYRQGDFTDLCRGPHVPSTGKIKAFKLMKLAGAYWRGDSKNEMLQRIYGTAFLSQKDLDAYLLRLEEAEKRDHRKIGRAMDLFHFQDEAPGMAFWHEKGWRIFQTIIKYLRQKLAEHQYQEISAPLMMDRILWEQSGHWEKFGQDGMFVTESENREYVVKPMNCPGHLQIYKQGIKSYRDLPLKLAEFGTCHRNESSGTLHGLMRIRQFTQDDAHIFCTPEQLDAEVDHLIDYTRQVYLDFGFDQLVIRLATRPEKRIGDDAVWDKAEKALEQALLRRSLAFVWAPGEGAFYGPKIEFHLRDCLDRTWQCGTIQVDFSMPARLGAEYVDEDGTRKPPVMIHRVIVGSVERFIGMLLEHYAGRLPLWLAPIHVVVMNITDKQADYAKNIVSDLKNNGVFAISDLRNEKIGFKIREHTLQKVPYLLVVGDKEVVGSTVSVRTVTGEDLGSMSISAFVERLQKELKKF